MQKLQGLLQEVLNQHHAYQEISWTIVYSIITTRLSDFVEFAKAVSRAAGLP